MVNLDAVRGWLVALLLCGPLVGAAGPPPSAEPGPTKDQSESLIRDWDALPKTTTSAEYNRYIADHKALLTASARPYGTALMWSLQFERSEAAQALLRAGVTIPYGAVALAARGGLDEIIPSLLARGVAASDRDVALLSAAKSGHSSTLQLLLTLGAKVEFAAPNDGFTSLHIAVMERRMEAIRALIAASAPLEAPDHHGKTPLAWGPFAYMPQEQHLYEKRGQPHDTVYVDPGEAEAITLLLDAGANLETTDEDGNTPLHHAAMLGSLRGAEALLARGASAGVKNRSGQTPLSLAKARKNTAMIELLSRKPSRIKKTSAAK